MIKELSDYYKLIPEEERVPLGWDRVVPQAKIVIDYSGKVRAVENLMDGKQSRAKSVVVPKYPDRNGSGVFPGFCYDKIKGYIIGFDVRKPSKDKPEKQIIRSGLFVYKDKDKDYRQYFYAERKYVNDLVADTEDKELRALLNYFTTWKPEDVDPKLIIQFNSLETITGNIVFELFETGNIISYQNPTLRSIWNNYYNSKGEKIGRCALSGRENVVLAANYPKLTSNDLIGAGPNCRFIGKTQSTFRRYGEDKGCGINIGKDIVEQAFSSLRYLRQNHQYIMSGGVDIFYWSDSKDVNESRCLSALFGIGRNENEGLSETEFFSILRRIANGKKTEYKTYSLRPDAKVYILGLEGKTGRGVIRFQYGNSFGDMLQNVLAHYDRMSLDYRLQYRKDSYAILSASKRIDDEENPEKLAKENSDKSAKEIPEKLVRGLFDAIVNGNRYPEILADRVIRRFKMNHLKDKDFEIIQYTQAAFLSAWLCRNKNIKENSMNSESEKSQAYCLGEWFAFIEWIQEKSNGSTRMSGYLKKIMETPQQVLPRLVQLTNAHLNKLGNSYEIKENADLLAGVGIVPPKFSKAQQAEFIGGYMKYKSDSIAKAIEIKAKKNEAAQNKEEK